MGAHITDDSTLPDISTIRKWFNGLGYPDELALPDWRMCTSIMQQSSQTTVHAMAFWARPLDLFRSAIVVDRNNGLPSADHAKTLSDLTDSHVLLYGNSTATLWLREWPGTVKNVGASALAGVSNLLHEHRDNLELTKIAEKKIRLRQYALYETDPQGKQDESWFVKPGLKETRRVFARIGNKVRAGCEEFTTDHASWLYRILALRVGLDREWGITRGLNQSSVSDYIRTGKQYPEPRRIPLSDSDIECITSIVLESLEFFTFSYIDPLLLLKALRIPAARKVEKHTNLYPTPRSAAWDMIASIPIHDEMTIFDPTVGTGTFLIAAAQSLWSKCGNRSDMMETLRRVVRGSDTSRFALDLSHVLLDFAYGWRDSGWQLGHGSAESISDSISSDHEWVVVGNPPWSATGRSTNEGSRILSAYISALRGLPRCWLATIVPRTVWTKRDRQGRAMRAAVSEDFQIESICELPWGAIQGGKSQSLAVVLSRGYPTSTTVWKRNDKKSAIHTIGYNTESNYGCLTTPPDGRFLLRRLSHKKRISDFYNVRIGLQPKDARRPIARAGVRGIPFVLEVGGGSVCSIEKELLYDDVWVNENFDRPAKKYRQEILCMPQVAVSAKIYEGARRLRAYLVNEPRIFSNRFFVCVPNRKFPAEFAYGTKKILTSILGKLWVHIFAYAGRDISKSDLERLPLPPYEQVMILGSSCSTRSEWAQHLAVCNAYGLTEEESAVIMALGYMLELGSGIPQDIMSKLKPDELVIDSLRRQIEELGSHGRDALKIELRLMDERDKGKYLLLSGVDYQIAIDKEAL